MTDSINKFRRSENMRRITSAGTKPEMIVRRMIHAMGFRFRTHACELPGTPDIVRRKYRQAIVVHGCFWHQHGKKQCLDGRLPKSNTGYWLPKLERNVERDKQNLRALRKAGWSVLVIWDCELKQDGAVARRLRKLFDV